MVKCSKQDLKSGEMFLTGKCMKYPHRFIIKNGLYVKIHNDWVLLDKVVTATKENIETLLQNLFGELGREVEDIDLLQNFVTL